MERVNNLPKLKTFKDVEVGGIRPIGMSSGQDGKAVG
jgi:hypothetical protein